MVAAGAVGDFKTVRDDTTGFPGNINTCATGDCKKISFICIFKEIYFFRLLDDPMEPGGNRGA